MIIYKATNKINGKIYIGQTIKTLHDRSLEHKSDSKRNNYTFPRAIKKWGFENFIWEELEKCSSQEELDKAEIRWIKKLKSQNRKIGYNIASGGNSGKEVGRKNLSKLWKTKEFREKMKNATRKGARKLTDQQISDIRKAYSLGYKPKVLAAYYGISNTGIQAVAYRKTWKEIKPSKELSPEMILELNELKKIIYVPTQKHRGPPRKLTSEQVAKMRFLKPCVSSHFWCGWFNISKSLAEKIYYKEKFPEIGPGKEEDFDPEELESLKQAIETYKNEAKNRQSRTWFKNAK